ncbi:hypothetical protein NKG94_05785 [Micromonospora sp. M12]
MAPALLAVLAVTGYVAVQLPDLVAGVGAGTVRSPRSWPPWRSPG